MGLATEYRAVLFDVDGVLLDSMSAHVAAWVAAGAELGLDIDPLEVYRREGEKSEVSARDFIKRAGLMTTKARVRRLVEVKHELFRENVGGPRLFAGAADALRVCRARDLRVAVVTGSSRAEWERAFPDDLKPLLDASVCGDDVLRGKPNPEPFMTAAARLGLAPARCLAVENAPYGIRSARTAGCRVIAVRSELPDAELAQAHQLVDDLAAFTTLL